MDPLALIEHAAARYRHLDQLGAEIEQTIHNNEHAALPALCERLHALQEQAKILDNQLVDVLQQRQELWRLDTTQEWLQLMRAIQERNQRLLPHIKNTMTIQRSELQTLRRGNAMLQGYKPGIVQTAQRFSSSG